MELSLNLAWTLLATLMLWLWMRHAPREGVSRRTQIVALAVIVLILLPVISVTDDLMAAQNVAETDRCQRKDHVCSGVHSAQFAIAHSFLPTIATLCFGSTHVAAPHSLPAPLAMIAAMNPIQNRPPPIA